MARVEEDGWESRLERLVAVYLGWADPRAYDARDRGDEWPRVYAPRDRSEHDPRESPMRDLDLPRGHERELVIDRDRVYEPDSEDSRTLAAVGAFRVVPEHDLDVPHDTLETTSPSTPTLPPRRDASPPYSRRPACRSRSSAPRETTHAKLNDSPGEPGDPATTALWTFVHDLVR